MAPRNVETSEDWQVNYAEIQMRAAHLFRSREWADCTFQFLTSSAGAAGDLTNTLDAHKLILAMASPVFAAMFYGNVGNKESPVTLSDIDLPTFSALLEYIYTDNTDISDVETAINLYKAANKYILVHLEKMCLDYLFDNLNPDKVCQIYEFACFFGKNTLEEKCLKMFSTKTQFVLKGSSFRNAGKNTVKKIISMDPLDISSEMDLLDALLDYVDHFKKTNNDQNVAKQSIKNNTDQEQGDTQTNNEDNNSGTSENKTLQTSNNIFEGARSILKGLIEDIRFLSMSPTDLAKINETTKVLAAHEISALFTNMFSPNSSTPMPVGFSSIREPRARDKATLRHTVHNVTSMTTDQNVYSPPCYVRRLPWRILAQKNRMFSEECYLGFYLECDTESLNIVSEDWSCNVKFQTCLLSIDPDTAPVVKDGEFKFCKKKSIQGWSFFLEWDTLIDPKNNFIKDDSITLEVNFTTEPVQGVNIEQFEKYCEFCNRGEKKNKNDYNNLNL